MSTGFLENRSNLSDIKSHESRDDPMRIALGEGEYSMKSFQNAVIVVTGAGCGIGRATALTFSRLGANVVLADIQASRIARVSDEISSEGGSVRALQVDVSDRRQVKSLAGIVLKEFKKVDVVVNNAGVLILGEMRLTSLEDFERIMGVNFWGVIHLVHSFLPSMIERRNGHFVNICSANGLAPLPYVGPYSASKSAVLVISETLRLEVARFGIGVTTVCPGLTKTEIRNEAEYRTDADAAKRFLDHFRERAEEKAIDPFKVAKKIPLAILGNRAFVRISPETYLLSWAYRFVPRLFRLGAGKVMKRIV
jgi:NAD(P)-dependent dehydrogenase (short-subunit alcohol dehydrogenase family)